MIIGYVGWFVFEKQVEDLQVIFELLNMKFVIVGDGLSCVVLEKMFLDVVFFGFFVGEKLVEVVVGFDFFVYLGENEIFCQIIQEVFVSGVLVVVIGCGGLFDLVQNS